MTVIDDREQELIDLSLVAGLPPDATETAMPLEREEPVGGASQDAALAPVNVALTCAATLLSTVAAGWMAAGTFAGWGARAVAVTAGVYGVGSVALSYRTTRPATVQYAAMAGAGVLGAMLVIPDATGGTANLPGLVVEAVRTGGISQPPIPFDPGWKFLLVAIVAAVGIGASAVAIELRRPKLGVALPVPVIVATLLLQPSSGSVVPTVVALLLAVGGLAVAYGADLAREGATSGRFEVRRFARGAGVMVAVVAILVVITQLGFLFPPAADEQIIPPKRPEPPPPAADRELFTVESTRADQPWRLGTLDVYRDGAWMTPPFASSRLIDVPEGGALAVPSPARTPGAPVADVRGATDADGTPAMVRATFRISDIDGRVIPTLANARRVQREDGFGVTHDPRTQSLRLERRAQAGLAYTIEAPLPAGGLQLATAGPPPPSMSEFLEIPDPPREVAELLAQVPAGASGFERLQFLRNVFYANVVAAGAGDPVDLPARRVGEMLSGQEATPYEITAGEALLARWAGVPSRIGYGYYGGDVVEENRRSVRPVHGSSWLEAYFDGFGWIAIVGTPPKAKSSLNDSEKKEDPTVRPTDELATVVFVPVQGESIVLLFTLVRYWLARVVPWLAVAVTIVWLYPGALKALRRWRRRRWAARGAPAHRLAVAYSEWRDSLTDYNLGHHSLTPIELLDVLKPDEEHIELAWLSTRGLWGDLARDLRDDDARNAEEMSDSLRRRLRRSQSPLFTLLAFASRASLRDPYGRELPNVWFTIAVRDRVRSPLRAARRVARSIDPRRVVRLRPDRAMMLALVLLVGTSGCMNRVDLSGAAPTSVLPASLVPVAVGDVTISRDVNAERAYAEAGERALVEGGRVFSLRRDGEPQATLQVAAFKAGLRDRAREVRAGVLETFGGNRFQLTKVGGERIYRVQSPEQQMLLWFPPDGRYYQLMVAKGSFEEAERVFAAVLAHQRGDDAVSDVPRPLDGRRGRAE